MAGFPSAAGAGVALLAEYRADAGAGAPAILQVSKTKIAELFSQPEQKGAGSMGTITINGERFEVDLICRSGDPHREPRRVFEDLPDMC